VPKKPKNAIDKVFGKARPGPDPRIPAATVVGRADNYRIFLGNFWKMLWPLLSRANSEEDVKAAFQTVAQGEANFSPFAHLILKIKNDPKFPKTSKGKISFLADSLGASGELSFRRSRDICAEERAKRKKAHHIIRCEYYVECSCGYEGPSLNRACKKCGAKIFPSAAFESYIG
jgi:hypothetical protein